MIKKSNAQSEMCLKEKPLCIFCIHSSNILISQLFFTNYIDDKNVRANLRSKV